MALAVSAAVCSAGGRTGTVTTVFGLGPTVAGKVICACAGSPGTNIKAKNIKAKNIKAKNINVAVSVDLMTNPGGH
jgi:hypothetical protein